MAGDFWSSSHYQHWLFAPQYPAQCLAKLPEGRLFTEEEMQIVHFAYAQSIIRLCKVLRLRFRVAATACVYFKRFYLLQSMLTECDPELMVPTAVLLASKVENMHDVNAEMVVKEYTSRHFCYKVEQVMEAEYFLLQALTFHLVIFHPFSPLEEFLGDCAAHGCDLQRNGFAEMAWAVLNDTYFTPLSLSYPPFKIALASVVVGATLCNVDLSPWLDGLGPEHLTHLEAVVGQIVAAAQLRADTPSVRVEELLDAVHRRVIEWRFRRSDDVF